MRMKRQVMRGRSNALYFASHNDVANQATRYRLQASLASGASIISPSMIKRFGGRVLICLMIAIALTGVAKLANLRAQELDIELITNANLLSYAGPGLR